MRTFTEEERRARLVRRHGLAPGHRAATVAEACEAMVCLHATDPATVYLSAWARVDGLTVADLDKALYVDRSLVKHLAMRRTLFVFPRQLFGVAQAAASDRVADQERRRLAADVEKAGLVPDGLAWLEAAGDAAVAALAAMGEATAAELRQAVELLAGSIIYAPDKSYGGPQGVGPRVLTTLSAAGRIVRGSNAGGWTVSRPRWATTAHWLGEGPPRPPEAEARAELVRRWLRTFGPGTVADIKWWLGSTLTAVRAALAAIGAAEVDLGGGRPGVALPDDLGPEPAAEPSAALLPSLDPTIMGWAERDWYLGPHRPQVFDTNGNAGATAWWEGRVVGGWAQTPEGEVHLLLLEDVGADGKRALEAEAARLTAWLDGVRVAARFPSPLSKAAAPPVTGARGAAPPTGRVRP